MKDYIEKIKNWVGENPALTGGLIAVIAVIIYYIFFRRKATRYEVANELPYSPPAISGGYGNSSGGTGSDDSINYANLYAEQNQEMLGEFAGVMQDMLSGFADSFYNNINKISPSPTTPPPATAPPGPPVVNTGYQSLVPKSIIPQVNRDDYVIPDIPAMAFKVFDTPEKQKGVYGSVIQGGQTGPYVAYGTQEVLDHFKQNPNTSINPAGSSQSYVLDFRNRPQSEAQKTYSKTFSEVKAGRSLEDAYRDLVNAGLLKGDPAAGEKQKAKRGV